jgi:Tfp pilus assembly protein PilO
MKRFLRCEWLIAFFFVVMALGASYVQAPYAQKLFSEGRALYGFWSLEKRAAAVKVKKKAIQQEVTLLDSLVTVYEQRMQGDEGLAAAMLYKRADSSGLSASRISVGEKVHAKGRDETGVTVRGRGSYAAIGRFCEAIENLPAPVRIRQIVIAPAGNGAIDAAIDFTLLSEKTAGDK